MGECVVWFERQSRAVIRDGLIPGFSGRKFQRLLAVGIRGLGAEIPETPKTEGERSQNLQEHSARTHDGIQPRLIGLDLRNMRADPVRNTPEAATRSCPTTNRISKLTCPMRGIARIGDNPERRVTDVPARVHELGVIEDVEKFETKIEGQICH